MHQYISFLYKTDNVVSLCKIILPLLIIVVVVMDFIAQIQSHLMSHQYESVMKKANLVNKANLDRFGR